MSAARVRVQVRVLVHVRGGGAPVLEAKRSPHAAIYAVSRLKQMQLALAGAGARGGGGDSTHAAGGGAARIDDDTRPVLDPRYACEAAARLGRWLRALEHLGKQQPHALA